MSTLKSINVIHPSGTVNNIVNDASGNVTVGNDLYVPSGNVGIGTTAPGPIAKLTVSNTGTTDNNRMGVAGSTYLSTPSYTATFIQQGDTATTGTACGLSNANLGALYFQNTSGGLIYTNGASPLVFGTTATERMRIDSSGNLLVARATNSTNNAARIAVSFTQNGQVFTPTTDNKYPIAFENAAGTTVGYIYTSSSATTYSTSSDYRLKDNVQPMITGLATVSALKPVTYDWKSDGSSSEGFIAHELQSVIPHAVTGEKDAVNKDGSIKPQGVDYSKIVVHLVAAIQELSAKNDALEARLAKLETVQ